MHPNPFETEEGLSRQITTLLESPDAGRNLLGAFAWMAVATARSLRRLLEIEVAERSAAEWRLHPELMMLCRTPPMRSRGWLPSKVGASDWVRPVAAQTTIILPPRVVHALRPLMKAIEDGTALGTLWHYPEAPAATWRKAFAAIARPRHGWDAGIRATSAPLYRVGRRDVRAAARESSRIRSSWSKCLCIMGSR